MPTHNPLTFFFFEYRTSAGLIPHVHKLQIVHCSNEKFHTINWHEPRVSIWTKPSTFSHPRKRILNFSFIFFSLSEALVQSKTVQNESSNIGIMGLLCLLVRGSIETHTVGEMIEWFKFKYRFWWFDIWFKFSSTKMTALNFLFFLNCKNLQKVQFQSICGESFWEYFC